MSRITEHQIKRLLRQSNLIEGYDDPQFDAQALLAWRYMLGVDFDQLDQHCICKVQKILTLKQTDLQPDQRGYFRKIPVTIGGNHTPAAYMVEPLMDNWLLDYRELDPIVAHIKFEKIHPFVDGNGRTGRLLMWWHCLKTDRKLVLVGLNTRQEYYRWFK